MPDHTSKQKLPTQPKVSPHPAETSLSEDASLTLDYLQRTIGNQATHDLLQRGVIQLTRDNQVHLTHTGSDILQLGGKRKKNKKGKQSKAQQQPTSEPEAPKLSQEEIRKRIIAGQKRRAEEKAKQNSWLNYFASWVPGGYYNTPEEEQDEPEFDDTGYQDYESETYEDPVGEVMEFEDEPEGEDEPENPFAIKNIVIDLGRTEYAPQETRLGTVKGSSQDTVSGDGTFKRAGKGSVKGSYGKGELEATLEQSMEGLSGEGKLGFLLGSESAYKSGELGWGVKNTQIEGAGEMQTKVGLQGNLAGKLAKKSDELTVEGQMGAFLGATAEGTVAIKIKSDGKDIGSTEGKLGMTFGVGGAIKGTLSFKGGVLTIGSAGKLSAGVGFAYGYKLTLNTQALLDIAPGWWDNIRYYVWDMWELPEDFEPLMI